MRTFKAPIVDRYIGERARRIISRLTNPIFSVTITAVCRFIYRFESSAIGKFRIYGTPDFILQCSDAMCYLSSLDTHIYNFLISQNVLCWLDCKQFPYTSVLCPISPESVAWEKEGIITCFVHFHFMKKIFYQEKGLNVHGVNELMRVVYAAVHDWLEGHNFPTELVTLYDLNST